MKKLIIIVLMISILSCIGLSDISLAEKENIDEIKKVPSEIVLEGISNYREIERKNEGIMSLGGSGILFVSGLAFVDEQSMISTLAIGVGGTTKLLLKSNSEKKFDKYKKIITDNQIEVEERETLALNQLKNLSDKKILGLFKNRTLPYREIRNYLNMYENTNMSLEEKINLAETSLENLAEQGSNYKLYGGLTSGLGALFLIGGFTLIEDNIINPITIAGLGMAAGGLYIAYFMQEPGAGALERYQEDKNNIKLSLGMIDTDRYGFNLAYNF